MRALLVFAVLISGAIVSAVIEDYYWRDFKGAIPEDAVIGGQSFGHNVYIGQAYIRNLGIFVGTIHPGVSEVTVTMAGVRRVDENVKILCGNQENFLWVPANTTNLHLVMLDKRPVLGGFEDIFDYIYVGRVNLEGGTIIGKVNQWNLVDASLSYANKGLEKTSKQYEVLTFVNSSSIYFS